MRKTLLIVFLITAINYAMMLFYSLPVLFRAADGLLLFDLRIMGYDQTAAQTYLNTITPKGRLFYLEVQQLLDLFFPALLALTFILILYHLAPRLPVLFLFPILGATFDYIENTLIRDILLSDTPSADLVQTASLMTGLKYTFIAASILTILWLWRGRDKGKA